MSTPNVATAPPQAICHDGCDSKHPNGPHDTHKKAASSQTRAALLHVNGSGQCAHGPWTHSLAQRYALRTGGDEHSPAPRKTVGTIDASLPWCASTASGTGHSILSLHESTQHRQTKVTPAEEASKQRQKKREKKRTHPYTHRRSQGGKKPKESDAPCNGKHSSMNSQALRVSCC